MSAPPTGIGEFDLIARYFKRPQALRHAALGIGDDCALLPLPPGQQLAISTDTLVSGRHFFADADPATVGHKALAVNLSDLAASGAQPLAFTLALTLPAVDKGWLSEFSRGLFALADAHGCELIGGDTTRGPLSITITVLGSVPAGQALLRSGAQVGDDIYVSHGVNEGLGDARLALHLLQTQRGEPPAPAIQNLSVAQQAALLQSLRPRLETPTPRIELGMALRDVATSCMDLSDGLQGDLRHILKASNMGATLWPEEADGSGVLAATSPHLRNLSASVASQYALAGGDDYELLFTAPKVQRQAISGIASKTGLTLTRIGSIDVQAGLRLQDANGTVAELTGTGHDHFVTQAV